MLTTPYLYDKIDNKILRNTSVIYLPIYKR